MRFNNIIEKLDIYLNKPEIDKKTLKEVVLIFYNSMSNQEREMFLKRCMNYHFELFNMLDLPDIQTSLERFIEKYKKFRSIKL